MPRPRRSAADAPPESAPVFDPARQVLRSRPGFLVRRLHQIHYALFFEECGEGMTPVQYGILTALSLRPGIDQNTLGAEVGLDRTTTADVLKRLEDKGWAERRVDPGDRRARQAFVTAEGLQVMGRLQGGMAAASERLLKTLSPAERRAFVDMLARLVEDNEPYGRTSVRSP